MSSGQEANNPPPISDQPADVQPQLSQRDGLSPPQLDMSTQAHVDEAFKQLGVFENGGWDAKKAEQWRRDRANAETHIWREIQAIGGPSLTDSFETIRGYADIQSETECMQYNSFIDNGGSLADLSRPEKPLVDKDLHLLMPQHQGSQASSSQDINIADSFSQTPGLVAASASSSSVVPHGPTYVHGKVPILPQRPNIQLGARLAAAASLHDKERMEAVGRYMMANPHQFVNGVFRGHLPFPYGSQIREPRIGPVGIPILSTWDKWKEYPKADYLSGSYGCPFMSPDQPIRGAGDQSQSTSQASTNLSHLINDFEAQQTASITSPSPTPAFTIGISGPTSSGKTTLANLLYLVFGKAVDNSGVPTTIVYQDDFFLPKKNVKRSFWLEYFYDPAVDANPGTQPRQLSKAAVPLKLGNLKNFTGDILTEYEQRLAMAQYRARQNDANVLVDPIKIFGPSPNGEPTWDEGNQNQNISRNTPILPPRTIPEELLETVVPVQRAGPNVDCRESLDWEGFTRELWLKQTGHTEQDHEISHQKQQQRRAHIASLSKAVQFINPEDVRHLRKRVQSAVNQIWDLNKRVGFEGCYVSKFGKSGELEIGRLRNMVIVEGFLLFADPKVGETGRMMEAMDVKVFLPVKRDTARSRRFTRKEYVDVEIGGEREAHMFWRTEAYFDGVAWYVLWFFSSFLLPLSLYSKSYSRLFNILMFDRPEYLSNHRWLFPSRNPEVLDPNQISAEARQHKVIVRPFFDANPVENLVWAVENILVALINQEGLARNAWLKKKQVQTTDAANKAHATRATAAAPIDVDAMEGVEVNEIMATGSPVNNNAEVVLPEASINHIHRQLQEQGYRPTHAPGPTVIQSSGQPYLQPSSSAAVEEISGNQLYAQGPPPSNVRSQSAPADDLVTYGHELNPRQLQQFELTLPGLLQSQPNLRGFQHVLGTLGTHQALLNAGGGRFHPEALEVVQPGLSTRNTIPVATNTLATAPNITANIAGSASANHRTSGSQGSASMDMSSAKSPDSSFSPIAPSSINREGTRFDRQNTSANSPAIRSVAGWDNRLVSSPPQLFYTPKWQAPGSSDMESAKRSSNGDTLMFDGTPAAIRENGRMDSSPTPAGPRRNTEAASRGGRSRGGRTTASSSTAANNTRSGKSSAIAPLGNKASTHSSRSTSSAPRRGNTSSTRGNAASLGRGNSNAARGRGRAIPLAPVSAPRRPSRKRQHSDGAGDEEDCSSLTIAPRLRSQASLESLASSNTSGRVTRSRQNTPADESSRNAPGTTSSRPSSSTLRKREGNKGPRVNGKFIKWDSPAATGQSAPQTTEGTQTTRAKRGGAGIGFMDGPSDQALDAMQGIEQTMSTISIGRQEGGVATLVRGREPLTRTDLSGSSPLSNPKSPSTLSDNEVSLIGIPNLPLPASTESDAVANDRISVTRTQGTRSSSGRIKLKLAAPPQPQPEPPSPTKSVISRPGTPGTPGRGKNWRRNMTNKMKDELEREELERESAANDSAVKAEAEDCGLSFAAGAEQAALEEDDDGDEDDEQLISSRHTHPLSVRLEGSDGPSAGAKQTTPMLPSHSKTRSRTSRKSGGAGTTAQSTPRASAQPIHPPAPSSLTTRHSSAEMRRSARTQHQKQTLRDSRDPNPDPSERKTSGRRLKSTLAGPQTLAAQGQTQGQIEVPPNVQTPQILSDGKVRWKGQNWRKGITKEILEKVKASVAPGSAGRDGGDGGRGESGREGGAGGVVG
jgi:hypothetical protein